MSNRMDDHDSVPDYADAYPHFTASALCAGGSYYASNVLKSTRNAWLTGAMSVLYGAAGYMIYSGQKRMGYDLGTAASLALLGIHGPQAYASTGKEPLALGMAVAGTLGLPWNALKSMQFRRPPQPVGSGSTAARMEDQAHKVAQKASEKMGMSK